MLPLTKGMFVHPAIFMYEPPEEYWSETEPVRLYREEDTVNETCFVTDVSDSLAVMVKLDRAL